MATRAPLHAAGSSKPRDEHAHRSSVFIQAHLFLGLTIGALTIWRWPKRWLLSGAPALTYVLWLGEATGLSHSALCPPLDGGIPHQPHVLGCDEIMAPLWHVPTILLHSDTSV